MMAARSVAGVALAGAVLLAACGDDGGGGSAGGEFSVAASLGEIPRSVAPDDHITITLGDLAGASEAIGVERPSSLDDVGAVVDWLSALIAGPVDGDPKPIFVPVASVFAHEWLMDVAEFEEELGWSIIDADTFVELDVPPVRFSVLTGDLEDALDTDGLNDSGDGVMTAGDGEDLETSLDERTAARNLGRPLHMAFDDGRLALALTQEAMAAWQRGDGDTVADDEGFAGIAAALDDADVLAAVVHRSEMGGGPSSGRSPDPAINVAFDTVGIGWSVVDGEAVMTVAYHLVDEDDAEDGQAQIEAVYEEGKSIRGGSPISDVLELEEISHDGAVVVATLSLVGKRPAAVPWQMLISRDLPFTYSTP